MSASENPPPTPSTSSSPQRTVLVTGASRGIGAATAVRLAQLGWRVIGSATTAAGAEAISQRLAAFAGSRGVVLDVTDSAALDETIAHIAQHDGGLHALVNNAGITRDALILRMKDEDWDAVLDANLRAVFRACRAAAKIMCRQRYGRICSITSVVGASGNPGQANYAAAKAGVAGLTRALARELGARGVTVNCVAPGFIATDMTDALPEAQKQALRAQIPLGDMGQPQDVAHAVAWLISDGAGYVTGQQIHVNGGMYM